MQDPHPNWNFLMADFRFCYINTSVIISWLVEFNHDDVSKWKHFQRYRPFVRGIYRSPVDSLTKTSDAELWCFLWSVPEQTVE